MINYDTVPVPYMADGVKRYIENRLDPGSFMAAVICNDLCGACGKADHVNQQHLFEWVQWFYNEAPITCWGSPEAYIAWLKGEDNE